MGSKFDPQEFFNRPDAIAALAPASELFGLLKRSLDLPAQWAALVTRKTGDHVMVQAGAIVDGRDADEVLLVRTSTFEVRIEEEGLTTKDGFRARADGRLQLSLIPERAELLSFRQAVLGSYQRASASDLARYLQPALRAALVGIAGEREADSLVDAGSTEAASGILAGAIEGPCFSAGLAVSDRPTVRFQSQTLEEVRLTRERVARRHQHRQCPPLLRIGPLIEPPLNRVACSCRAAYI